MTRPLPLLAACCAVMLIAAACTDDDPGPNFSSVPTTPTISASTSPTESTAAPNTTANVPSGAASPSRPAAASSRTSDGAFAFVSYYWRMVDWAYSTNNGNVLSGLYQPTCASCASFKSSISESAARGYTLIGGHISIGAVNLGQTDGVSGAQFGIDIALTVDKLESRGSDGAVAASYPPASPTYRMYVGWIDDRWQIVESATVTTK